MLDNCTVPPAAADAPVLVTGTGPYRLRWQSQKTFDDVFERYPDGQSRQEREYDLVKAYPHAYLLLRESEVGKGGPWDEESVTELEVLRRFEGPAATRAQGFGDSTQFPFRYKLRNGKFGYGEWTIEDYRNAVSQGFDAPGLEIYLPVSNGSTVEGRWVAVDRLQVL